MCHWKLGHELCTISFTITFNFPFRRCHSVSSHPHLDRLLPGGPARRWWLGKKIYCSTSAPQSPPSPNPDTSGGTGSSYAHRRGQAPRGDTGTDREHRGLLCVGLAHRRDRRQPRVSAGTGIEEGTGRAGLAHRRDEPRSHVLAGISSERIARPHQPLAPFVNYFNYSSPHTISSSSTSLRCIAATMAGSALAELDNSASDPARHWT
jgi:hypothetical protein